MKVWNIIDCTVCGKMDFVFDSFSKIFILEVNTLPVIIKNSLSLYIS